jgi:hypothetical protein
MNGRAFFDSMNSATVGEDILHIEGRNMVTTRV